MKFGMLMDREGLVGGDPSIVDIKISRQAEAWHGAPLAGYAICLPHCSISNALARFMARKRYIAKLNEQGKKARLIPYESLRDSDAFRSGFVISHWKLSQG